MKKILFYANNPGGANAVKSLIKPLEEKGCKVFVYGSGAALKILPRIIEYQDNSDTLINKVKPDFVITGTSTDCLFEKQLIKSARNNKILTMSVLDSWCNYNRFTPYSCSELKKNKKYNELEFLPDFIIVPDEYAKQEAIKESIPQENLYALGNPHFEAVKEEFKNINAEKLRRNMKGEKKKLVIWGSEPYIEDYGQGMELECLEDVVELMHEDWQLVVKPHPREKENKFDNFQNIKIACNINSREIIKAADLVISMTSMLLTEAIIAGKPALSYQKYENDRDKFILTKMSVLPFINSKAELKKYLNKPFKISEFEIKFKAKDRIIKLIEEKLCLN